MADLESLGDIKKQEITTQRNRAKLRLNFVPISVASSRVASRSPITAKTKSTFTAAMKED